MTEYERHRQLAFELYKVLVGNLSADAWDFDPVASRACDLADAFVETAYKRYEALAPEAQQVQFQTPPAHEIYQPGASLQPGAPTRQSPPQPPRGMAGPEGI